MTHLKASLLLGRSQRGPGGMPPIVDRVDFLRKNWLCWDVRPALFGKVLSTRNQKCSGSSRFEGEDWKRSSTFFLEKITFVASVPPPPNVKSWLRAWLIITARHHQACQHTYLLTVPIVIHSFIRFVHSFIHSFIHSSKNWFRWSNVNMTARTPNNVKRKDRTAAQDENGLSCAVEFLSG